MKTPIRNWPTRSTASSCLCWSGCELLTEEGRTLYGLSIDQPLDVRFGVPVGPTHQAAVLVRRQHQVGGFVQPVGSR